METTDMMEQEWKRAVLEDAKRGRESFRESSAWLQDAFSFDHSLQLTNNFLNAAQEIFKLCGLKNRPENRNNLETLIANLVNAQERKPIRVSLSPNRWKRSRYTTAGASTIKLIHTFKELGFIQMKIGYHTEQESRDTRIWPTENLLQYFVKLDGAVIRKPVELVELRDDKGKLKPYKDTVETNRIRKILEKVNEVNARAKIRYQKEQLNASLVAVFSQDFSLYGRLHTRGYRHYQGRPEDERAKITINGDPIIELDFSGLHPYLIYAMEGIQFFGDPYTIVDQRPQARPFLKQILLCMLNSKDESKAEKAANYWLFRNHRERQELEFIGIKKARSLMKAFRQAHAPIDHYFCSGKETGLRTMNKDARIALDIVYHFAKQEIPILCVHDSFLVQQQYQRELKKVMQQMYRRHSGGFRIKIK